MYIHNIYVYIYIYIMYVMCFIVLCRRPAADGIRLRLRNNVHAGGHWHIS